MKSITLFLSVLLARSVVAQSTPLKVSSGTTGTTTRTVVVSTIFSPSTTPAVSVTVSTSSLGYTIITGTSIPAEVSSYLSVISAGQSSTAPSTTSANSKTSSESASTTTTVTSTSIISVGTTTTIATSTSVSTSRPAQFTGGASTTTVGVSSLMGVYVFCLLRLSGL